MKKNILFMHSGGFWKSYTLKKAKELGYGVIVAQHNYSPSLRHIDDIIPIDVLRPHLALDQFTPYQGRIDGVVTFFELAVESTALIVDEWNLIGNSFTASRKSRDKYLMRKSFSEARVPSVKGFGLIDTADDILKFGKKHGYPVILKPTKFGAAAGVVRINNDDEAHKHFGFVRDEIENFCDNYEFPREAAQLMVETMIDPGATEINVDLIVHDGEPLVISVAEKPQDTSGPTFQENDYVMPPINIEGDELERMNEIAVRAVKALGLRWGAAHLEMKASERGGGYEYAVVEVGARCGGDLEVHAVKASTGVDLSEIVIRQAAGDFSDDDFSELRSLASNYPPKDGVAVQVIYAPKNGTIESIIVPDSVKDDPKLLMMEFEFKPGDRVKMHYSDYVGALMVRDRTPAKALRLANDLTSKIKIEMA